MLELTQKLVFGFWCLHASQASRATSFRSRRPTFQLYTLFYVFVLQCEEVRFYERNEISRVVMFVINRVDGRPRAVSKPVYWQLCEQSRAIKAQFLRLKAVPRWFRNSLLGGLAKFVGQSLQWFQRLFTRNFHKIPRFEWSLPIPRLANRRWWSFSRENPKSFERKKRCRWLASA